MTETINETTGADSSESAPVVLCSKCKVNPRATSRSYWCRPCNNEHSRQYREKYSRKETFEERVCALEGCENVFTWRSTHAKQETCCRSHYGKKAWRDSRPPEEFLPESSKRCTKCKEVKLQIDFSPSQYGKNRGGICKVCMRAYSKKWSTENRDRSSAASRRSKTRKKLKDYKAYTDDILQIEADQGGKCAICGGGPNMKNWHIDHDHTSGLFRALLCGTCNVALGALGDDPKIVIRAALYLEHHKRRIADILASEESA
jgi:hypothetical protein